MRLIADRYVVGPGALFRVDRGSRTGSAGSCFQVLSAGTRPFRLRTSDDARGALCTSAIIPPAARFVVEGDHAHVATVFLEPDGILGRRAQYEMVATSRRGPSAWCELGERLVPSDLWTLVAADDYDAAFRRLAGALDRKQRGLAYAGPKVLRATELVESSLPSRVSLAALARAVDLSLEQLTRTLLDEVGLAARPYVRWLRLQRYARLVHAGATIDDAARAIGYRRRAELTEDLRRLAGLTDRDLDARDHWTPLSAPAATVAGAAPHAT